MSFDFRQCSLEDRAIARRYIGDLLRPADLTITTEDDKPYLYRWHVIPRTASDDFGGNIYFHVQTSSDPERPLHDHPWANMSVILSGGYDEVCGPIGIVNPRRKGDVVFRAATDAHRLVLPEGIPYTMTQFTTGPYERKWGFWVGRRWYPYDECVRTEGTKTIFKYPAPERSKI